MFALLALDHRGYAVPREVHQSVCLLSDAPNQCGAFTLSRLGPLFADMDELKIRLSESKIQAVQERVENNIREVVETEMQAVRNRIQALEETLLSVSKKFEGQLQSSLDRMQDQLKAVQNKLERDSVTGLKDIPPNFELIGSRYFYIEDKVWQNFTTAASTCRQMGGYLASIKDEEELNLIRMKLENEEPYWLGTNDHKEKGSFVSLASGKPAFLNIDLENMMMYDCDLESYFICQADKEI
ncbi:accessory gland protein Acp29AB-like [Drosophila rhopaloa]|uniref:Accessory gland protein Acp29AB-like n=1 Tax=Drosophila rhopaloa TaxID=1041015 RepID=A0A6P4FBH7_DRORH|nr:accessory gland protein Acp29AB-like [Drosophila rhopaloa]